MSLVIIIYVTLQNNSLKQCFYEISQEWMLRWLFTLDHFSYLLQTFNYYQQEKNIVMRTQELLINSIWMLKTSFPKNLENLFIVLGLFSHIVNRVLQTEIFN